MAMDPPKKIKKEMAMDTGPKFLSHLVQHSAYYYFIFLWSYTLIKTWSFELLNFVVLLSLILLCNGLYIMNLLLILYLYILFKLFIPYLYEPWFVTRYIHLIASLDCSNWSMVHHEKNMCVLIIGKIPSCQRHEQCM